jgi:hypothetical protein
LDAGLIDPRHRNAFKSSENNHSTRPSAQPNVPQNFYYKTYTHQHRALRHRGKAALLTLEEPLHIMRGFLITLSTQINTRVASILPHHRADRLAIIFHEYNIHAKINILSARYVLMVHTKCVDWQVAETSK